MEMTSSKLGREISRIRRGISTLRQDVAKLDWSQFDPKASALCLPAMAFALSLGFIFHQQAAGIIIAGATLPAGLSSFRRLQGSRLLQMLLTTLGMSAGTSLGTLGGHWFVVTTICAGLFSFIYGLILIFNENASWIGLQTVITFLVASAFPSHGWHALVRGALVLVGGGLQMAMLLLLLHGPHKLVAPEDFQTCRPGRVFQTLRTTVWPALKRQVTQRLPGLRYAIRLSLTLMCAVLLSRSLHQLNSYWLPMTTLIILKPDFYRTYTNSVARVLGTFAGVLLASALNSLLHPSPLLICGFVLAFAWASFAWIKVNYGVFSCALTAFIVFLVALTGIPEFTVTLNRLLDTALGSFLALASRAIGPKWDRIPSPEKKS